MRNRSDDRSRARNLRNGWVFEYAPAEVLAAAEKKVQYHKERLAWWRDEASQAEQTLKDKGFEYRSRYHTGGTEVEIVGDPELARRVSDCKKKIIEHEGQQMVYETWVRALRAQTERAPDAPLNLKIADILFFGL